jgi:hypothetical protein
MRNPVLKFSLPAFNVTYCDGYGVFTVPITNTGDGTAYSGTLAVDLSPFNVAVTPPASYSSGAFHLPPIPPRPDLQPGLHPDPPLGGLHDAPQRHLQLQPDLL